MGLHWWYIPCLACGCVGFADGLRFRVRTILRKPEMTDMEGVAPSYECYKHVGFSLDF